MIVHRSNGNTGAVKKLFDAEYEGVRNEKAYFKGYGGYIKHVGLYDNTYRLTFPDQNELKVFIEDLIELYNSREGSPSNET
jgi:hypothetical protein